MAHAHSKMAKEVAQEEGYDVRFNFTNAGDLATQKTFEVIQRLSDELWDAEGQTRESIIKFGDALNKEFNILVLNPDSNEFGMLYDIEIISRPYGYEVVFSKNFNINL